MPAAPALDGLPPDPDLLQRWAATGPRSSFPRRHASFDSPCEVPLPSPRLASSATTPISRIHDGYFPVQPPSSTNLASSTNSSSQHPSSTNSSSQHFPVFDESESDATSASSLDCPPSDSTPLPRTTTLSTPIFPFPRPYSLPAAHDTPHPPSDRFSSASLPLPCSVPFSTLPRAASEADAAAHAARVRQAHRSEVGDTWRTLNYPYSHILDSSVSLASGSASGSGSSSGESSSSSTHESDDQHHPDTRRSPSPASEGPATFAPPPEPSYPAPDPPTILAPTMPPGPFLSHAPPPPDSWIQVETSTSEYRLNVRLPGFKRDGITLATKKGRTLHVVADCWENGGGHFERRISFGYDADLVQVRAEFDGEMLRVRIPRRLPYVDIWRPAPLGRTG